MGKESHLSIRLDKELHDKFVYIAKYDGRSMSGQILYLVKTAVRDFEKAHGPISEEDLR